jgi:hypothetical protein
MKVISEAGLCRAIVVGSDKEGRRKNCFGEGGQGLLIGVFYR